MKAKAKRWKTTKSNTDTADLDHVTLCGRIMAAPFYEHHFIFLPFCV